MPRSRRLDVNEGEILRLHEQGNLSQYEIARQLNLPRSTVRNRLAELLQTTQAETTATMSTTGVPTVDTEKPEPKRTHWMSFFGPLRTKQGQQALRELIVWWQERTAAIQRASDANRQTERITFHVERRWVEAIRRKADLDEMTLTQVVNEAFRHYFER